MADKHCMWGAEVILH